MTPFPGNDVMFAQVRVLHLPLGHYAITSGGTLGIRGLRAITDVDIIVSDSLWYHLARRYRVTREDRFDRLRPTPDIEILGPDSFLAPRTGYPTITEQLATADLIDGLSFVSLLHVLYFKREILRRPKDLADIATIEAQLLIPA